MTTATSILAGITAGSQAANNNPAFTVTGAAATALASIPAVVKSVQSGNVAPATSSAFNAVGALLLAVSPYVTDEKQKNSVLWAGRALIAVGAYFGEHAAHAGHALEVAQSRLNQAPADDLEMGPRHVESPLPVVAVPHRPTRGTSAGLG
ncbi:hypothetical protein J2X68_008040 [Streptomyces sp. 3330]|uniref:hypothetical protein n=1 Tax=Streptomyces sp. 3330 TaxID=2817755 RepID=UPI002858BDCE|nr:hypothetical protein [Streptomyces sp. 3330]MDR6981297.1 hypothetical protein [Streptomyces sp. 3330]